MREALLLHTRNNEKKSNSCLKYQVTQIGPGVAKQLELGMASVKTRPENKTKRDSITTLDRVHHPTQCPE